ncbi:MAG: SAM-dependent methyltransferase [Thermodesulfobacteriota bacterium]
MDQPLLRWIADRIAERGPVPFATFMEWALYHPEHGYYSSGRVRVGDDRGDFTTAPHLTGLFARCLARFVRRVDQALGQPDPFVLAEGGPGEGRLARDLLDCLRETAPHLYRRLRYAPDEASPALRERQALLWAPHRDRLSPWPPPAPVQGIYLSNELLDAFPVHRLVRRQEALLEIHVALEEAGKNPQETPRLREVLLPPSRPELAARWARWEAGGVALPEGCEAEVNLQARSWLAGVSSALARGVVLTIDYGDEAARLYGPRRPRGTALAYRAHRAVVDLLEDPGGQDLTAHVDFTSLRRDGEELGLEAAPLLHLRDFLFASGLLEDLEALERDGLDETAAWEARRAAAPLLLPGQGMGEAFQVLVQARGVGLSALPLDPAASRSGASRAGV